MNGRVAVNHDPVADAIWVILARGEYIETRELDDRRRIDLAKDGSVLRVELLDVSDGVDVSGLPRAAEIAGELRRLGVPVVEAASSSVSA
jgi:uncharacterized protein YuzE